MTDHVILLHGLWMRGFALLMLHRRMMEAGFRVHRFDYMSVAAPQERILERLEARVHELAQEAETVHLVGHSLGGLLALQVCTEDLQLPRGRVVCLGSPLKGSAAARRFAGMGRGGEVLLGHNRELLEYGFERWNGSREVGVVAGRLPLGLGAVLGQFGGDNDGTVAVDETCLPGIADHCVIETNHTGLLFSQEAARQVTQFLQQGRFDRSALT
jgi:pimeloyl-ACP methyl ester carboxylesterase